MAISYTVLMFSHYFRVQNMLRSGIMSRMAKRWWVSLAQDPVENTPVPVKVMALRNLFLLWAAGITTSVLFLITELALRKLKQHNFWLSNIRGNDVQLTQIWKYSEKWPLFCTLIGTNSWKEAAIGGLEVGCWPLVPKFAGSNPAEAVSFFRAKKSLARLPSEGK